MMELLVLVLPVMPLWTLRDTRVLYLLVAL